MSYSVNYFSRFTTLPSSLVEVMNQYIEQENQQITTDEDLIPILNRFLSFEHQFREILFDRINLFESTLQPLWILLSDKKDLQEDMEYDYFLDDTKYLINKLLEQVNNQINFYLGSSQ